MVAITIATIILTWVRVSVECLIRTVATTTIAILMVEAILVLPTAEAILHLLHQVLLPVLLPDQVRVAAREVEAAVAEVEVAEEVVNLFFDSIS
jgi:hypothetical protein